MVDVMVILKQGQDPERVTSAALHGQLERQLGQPVRRLSVRQDKFAPCPLAIITHVDDDAATV